MNIESTFIFLFVIAMGVAIGVRHFRLPYTVGLVLAGLILGWAHFFPAPELNRSLLFSVFLPGLVFEAAFHLNFEDLWRNRITIASLAVPGVVASTVLIAIALPLAANAIGFLPGMTWRHALVFGALISATDPVAVLAMFGRLGTPRRLSFLIESESLLNDGTGIVFFTLSLSIFAGTAVTARGVALEFVTVVGMGVLIGLAVALVVSVLLRHINDPMIEVSLTAIAAYGSFIAADELQYSGVIATVVAGILCGNYGARAGMSPSTRVAAETFWELVAFALNSIVFLLIGLEVPIVELVNSWFTIVSAYLIVTFARIILVQAVWRLAGFTRERFPWRWSLVLTWGGLRGALPMVLALGLPSDFPLRQQIVSTTFGVVILSILGQGLTMSPLLRCLGIIHAGADREAYRLLRGEAQTAAAALEEIDRLERFQSLSPDVAKNLKSEYRQRIEHVHEKIGNLTTEGDGFGNEALHQARRHLLMVERNRAVESYRQGLIPAAVHDRILADIDARILELESTRQSSDGS